MTAKETTPKNGYIFQKSSHKKLPFVIRHRENFKETFIALTDNAEKADFITKACNQFTTKLN